MKRFIKIAIICLLGIGLFIGVSHLLRQGNDTFLETLHDLLFPSDPIVEPGIDEYGTYTSKEDVALYIYTYGKLPSNYVTKKKAKDMGWVASKGNLQDVCEDCTIGGDRYTNSEGSLPKKDGRKYYECDIDYHGGTRNAKRIVYSNDGLVYYTGDHYSTFELLYGEP